MPIYHDRNTPQIKGDKREIPIVPTTKIYGGSIVLIDSFGHAMPGKIIPNQVCVGVAEKQASGENGDTHVIVKSGVFGLNKARNENVTSRYIGKNAYVLDEETVTISSLGKTLAGKIFDVSGDIIWVKI